MKRKLTLWMAVCLLAAGSLQAQGLLNKVKQKVNQEADKAVNKALNPNQPNTQPQNEPVGEDDAPTDYNDNNGDRAKAEMISTPPDVKQNLTDAETAYKAGQYGESRHAVQQAMLGVEMEIGNVVLKSLPENVSGMAYQKERDQVTSTGWGWAGLTIRREYLSSDNKRELTATVANNAAWMQAVNMYFTSGYAQSTGQQQDWKEVKVQGYRAILEVEGSGFKLSVPIGQTSMLLLESDGIAKEQDLMTAANAFSIDHIKKLLGEQ
jgi:hypothetical protein